MKEYVFKEISFRKRENGKNSINIAKIIRIGIYALRDFAFYKNLLEHFDENQTG